MMKKIELLAPAGDLERLKVVLLYGADAVYCGTPTLSLRSRSEIQDNLHSRSLSAPEEASPPFLPNSPPPPSLWTDKLPPPAASAQGARPR